MAAGGNLSSTLAIIITFMYLILYYKRRKIRVSKKQISPERNKTNGQLLKAILAMSIPITISSVISVVNPIIDSSTVSRCIQTAFASIITGGKEALEAYAMNMTGILAKMDTLVGLPVAINVAFSTALTPAIAAAIAKKDYKTASKSFTLCCRFYCTSATNIKLNLSNSFRWSEYFNAIFYFDDIYSIKPNN